MVVGLLGCGSGGASVGESCSTVADCGDGLQCLDHICRPECVANIDCGDGWECKDRTCHEATGRAGDACRGEARCGPGLTCRLPPTSSAGLGTCEAESVGTVTGGACGPSMACRSGECAVGRCVELCDSTTECLRGFVCTVIPRLSEFHAAVFDTFRGCLPTNGRLTYDVPLQSAAIQAIAVPVLAEATSLTVVAEADSPNDTIGALYVTHDGESLYSPPATDEDYYTSPLRHRPLPGISVIQIPSSSDVRLSSQGAYTMGIEISNPAGPRSLNNARVRVVEKIGNGATLAVHFHFADLTDHPCLDRPLTATTAVDDDEFQNLYLAELEDLFAQANIAIDPITYDDHAGPPLLAGLPTHRAGELFATSTSTDGISIYLMRTLAPAGTEIAVGGTPGAPLPGTRASGVAVAMTPLCYRAKNWPYLARITAHAMARHMGLYRSRDPGPPYAVDPINDNSTDSTNLMYWTSDLGTTLSTGQIEVLRRSAVLR